MSSLSLIRFYVSRTLRMQRLGMSVLLVCVVLVIIAAAALWMQGRQLDLARGELARLEALAGQPSRVNRGAPSPAADLPAFSSGALVGALNETASESDIKLDEVTYVLDDNAAFPYLRYRVTMSVKATYPLVRRLAERLGATIPNVTIDAIKCGRKDALVAELSCDVALSAFFRKDGHRG